MDPLKVKFKEKSAALSADIKALLKEHGNKIIDHVTLGQAYGGMRDIKSMIWETSLLDAQDGIRFRGFSIPELQEKLPTGRGKEPLPEGLFWLMLTGEVPTDAEALWLTNEWERRRQVAPHVFAAKMLSVCKAMTPMVNWVIAWLSLGSASIAAKTCGAI